MIVELGNVSDVTQSTEIFGVLDQGQFTLPG